MVFITPILASVKSSKKVFDGYEGKHVVVGTENDTILLEGFIYG